ncbi:Putative transcription antitermination regulator [Mycobacteroides abscessus subsp. abscessus]|nr:Putative transcription antitermination regulator [Mycobacteroides abscessus subsp. abscessus]
MSDELSEEEADAELEQALAGGTPQHVGWFRFYFADERWEWSPQVAQMHGYEPGEITPTTEIILSHKHPDDYRQVAATLEEIRRTAQAFSTRHRIIDVQQHVHHVVVIGDQLCDDNGVVVGTHGFYVDVTSSIRQGLCPSSGVKGFGRRFPRRPASLKEGTHVRVEEDIACAAVADRN